MHLRRTVSPPARRPSVSATPLNIAAHSPPSVAPLMLATSPPSLSAFGSPPASSRTPGGSVAQFPAQQGKALAPFPVVDAPVKVLLLENVNTAAVDMLKLQGYHVEEIKKALAEDELISKLTAGNFQAVGIRSKTKVTAKVIAACPSVSPLDCRLELGSVALTQNHAFSPDISAPFSFLATAPRHRMLLYRNKSSRPASGSESRHRRLQLALLQLALRRRTRHF